MTTTQSATGFTADASYSDAIVEMRDISVTFDMERGDSRVVDDVDLDLQRNEILGLVGESGSGKSMLASAVLDAIEEPGILEGEVTYHPETGEPFDVLELGKEELRQYRWEKVSMVFQGAMSSFNPTRKLRTHFVETLEAHGDDVDEGMERARQLLSDLYLEPDRVLDSYAHELSGGMQQRALIALSLVLEPEVLVMDEPTAALDLLMQRSIISLIKEVQEKYDLTIIFITHDLPLIAELVDRVAVMYAFELVEIGAIDDILPGSAHPYTRLLLQAMPDLESPVEAMRPIEGKAPDPTNVPEGCSFHPRCPMADDHCVAEDPHAYRAGDGHASRCHYWDEAEETIPLDEPAGGSDALGETVDSAAQRSWDVQDEPLLSLRDLEVHFEEEQSNLSLFSEPDVVRAVDGVDLDVYERDVMVLIGESGCGKTTLGKASVGLQRPTGGTAKYRGEDLWDIRDGAGSGEYDWDSLRRALQIIHQDPGSSLNPHRRVDALLEDPLKRWQPELDANDRRARILGLLDYVGMTPPEAYIDRFPHQLSGGEQQRIAIIRAMLMNPELILADEPVSALDVSLRVEMMDLMLRLQDEFDTSYLYVSHDLANARYITEKTGGRIGILYLGNLVEVGPPEAIIEDPKHPYTKALRWATPELLPDGTEETEEMPLREIDIPDPKNPPSGCPFHTRCPEAREACTTEMPDSYQTDGATDHEVACFRERDDHPYWESDPLPDAADEDPQSSD